MALSDELKAKVGEIFRSQWNVREGQVVPEPEGVKLGNEAVHFDRVTILYADLSGSTNLVNTLTWQIAAEVFKTFLHCAATLIRAEGGAITAYDGDRVMAVFIGDSQSTTAARCALKINYAVKNIVQPAFASQYPNRTYSIRHVVGIDTTEIRVARTGVRGGNDLVWVGRAANYAAKLTEESHDYATWITKDTFDRLDKGSKYGGKDNQLM